MRAASPRAVALVGLLVLGTWGGHAEAQGRKAPPTKKGAPPAAAPATLPAPPGPPVSAIPPLSETLNDGARREYEAAKALYAMNDSKGAFYKFQAAYELFADPRLLWNMATCAKNLHQYADALLLVRKYQKLGGGLLTDEDRAEAAAVERALAALTTTFVFRGLVPGAEVTLDDKPVDRPQEPVVADLGPHRIAVRKPGFHAFQVTVTGRPMAEIPIDVQLAPELHQGTIVVNARPGEAIFLDGRSVGLGTYRGTVSSGGHQVRVTAKGMQPFQQEIILRDDETRTVPVTLEAEKSGVPAWMWVAGSVLVAASAATITAVIIGGSGGTEVVDKSRGVPPGSIQPGVVVTSF